MEEKIVFFGSGPYAKTILEILQKSFEIEKVITTQSSGELQNYCASNNINTVQVSSLSDFATRYPKPESRVAVLASFGLIIPSSVLNLFEFGILNIHPSLLPKFRGPTPVQSAILQGEPKTGVTIIKLDREVDHGPILSAADYPISGADTAENLYNVLFRLGADLLVDALPKYLNGELTPVEQNHENATYTESLTRDSGFIDLNDSRYATGDELNHMIRAFYPWPGVWFKYKLNGNEKVIKLLPEDKIQVEGKNIMSLKDFENGYSEGKEIIEKLRLN